MPYAKPAHRRALTLAAGAGLLALAGCGSAASDASALAGAARPAPYPGRITLASEPPGASCVLTNTATQAAAGSGPPTAGTPAPVAPTSPTHIPPSSSQA